MPEPFDSGDLDALADLEQSPGYALVRERIEKEIERRRAYLEVDGDIKDVCWSRGYIRALRMVLDIPRILRDEIKGQLDKE